LKIAVLVSSFILLIQTLCAQSPDSLINNKDDLTNNIGISIGIIDFHMRDELGAPLTFGGIGIASDIQYMHKGKKDRHIIELTMNYDELGCTYDEYVVFNGTGSLRYNYLREVLKFGSDKNKYSFFVGGGLRSFINLSQYSENYVPGLITTTMAYTWYVAHTAEVSLLFDYNRSPSNEFAFQLFIPVIMLVSRPPYSIDESSSGTIMHANIMGTGSFFWENPSLQFKAAYEHKISHWCWLYANYSFQYSSFDNPRTFEMYMNNLLVGVDFLF
jgi:hypothetical protein